jgi:polyisoprenoid-binding protein YceI
MFRNFAIAAVIAFGILGLGASTSPSYTAGSWQVDTRHSDVQLITDATTDYGKTKMNITLGFGRVNGTVIFDDSDPAKSNVDLRFYPATSMLPSIAEDGKFRNLWLANSANHTLVCFHSKSVTRTSDGKLQATGTMVLTRVDRSIQAEPNEGYAGPVYGPPIVHRISHEMTLVFDRPAAQGNNQKGAVLESASTKVFREDFPQLLKAVTATYWPPVVQDKTCQSVDVGEDYHGIPCTGTMLEAPGFPEPPHAGNGEDIGAAEASDFNAVVGERLNILVHMRLLPTGSGQPGMGN